MPIKISEHILSLDENILAASLFTKQFHIVESTVRPSFNKRFKISTTTEDLAPAYAAAIHGIAKAVQESFGEVEKITVDYGRAKLLLMALRNDAGFVGLVLNKAVNGDYLALRIETEMDGANNEIDALV
jgi:predicted regulator of Ras-like GTPase activity (Roadblock/LC7/MglB family)